MNENKCPDHPERNNLYCLECVKEARTEGYKEGQTDTVKRISEAIKELDDKLINPDYDDLKAVIEAVQKQFKVD